MKDPLETLREKYWINIYHSDNPKAPICSIEFVEKDNKDIRFKYPVWEDKEKDGKGYVGKLDVKQVDSHNEAKGNAYQPQDDVMSDEIPFAYLLPMIAPMAAMTMFA